MNAILTKCIFLLTFAAVLGGCATSGPKYAETASTIKPQDPQMARIYLYRTMLLGVAVQPEVKVNGNVVGRAVPNGYFYVDLRPGACEITTTTEVERRLSLTLEPGQTRYVKLNLSIGFFVGHVYPELMDNEVGAREMADTRYAGT